MDLRLLDAFASTHHGVITRRVAVTLGVDDRAWYRAIASHHLELLHPGVARLVGSPRTDEQRILAAVWACGPGAMASHRSAALVWGVPRGDDPTDVIVDVRTTSARVPGLVAHHPRDLAELVPVVRRGIPTTNPLRMLLDLGAVDPGGVAAALDHVVTTWLATPDAVGAFLDRHQQRGRHGIRALRAALHSGEIDRRPADSVLERRLADIVTRYRLPAVEFHAIVAGYEVDFLVVGTRVVLECDGWLSHGLDDEQFEFDRARDAQLSAAGYLVVHFTWKQITLRPDRVAGRIESVLRTWAPDLLTRMRRRAA